MRFALFFVFFVTSSLMLYAQKKNEAYQLPIRKSTDIIHIDGVVDEVDWAQATTATDFFMVTPMDTSKAKKKNRC